MPQPDRPPFELPVAPETAGSAAAAPAAQQESFVINLCSSTTPMALTQPQLAELKRYTFFVSRRLEDGRERFRLHMGYFDSLLQAEDLLPLVRDLYPGAWAGEAPGKRLRARAAAAAPGAAVLANAPTLMPPSAAATEATAEAPVLQLALVAEPDPAGTASTGAEPQLPTPPIEAVLSPVPPPPASPAAVAPAAAAAAAPAPKPSRRGGVPFNERSNVREVLKSLDESGRLRQPPMPEAPAPREPGVLPESRVMRLLEEKNGDPLSTTSTPAAYAVQLQWSVQQIDLAAVPPLAIFGAYMLYTVEGSHEGRKWYGLRLGFFSDANSAKSVAQYVRSEFNAVAVVPVSLKERDGAQGSARGGTGLPATGTTEKLPHHTAEFKLLEDGPAAPPAPPAVETPAEKPRPAAGKGGPRTGYRVNPRSRGNRVNAQDRRGPKTLEETLEILGADRLQIERAPQKRLAPLRSAEAKAQRNSAFSRLLDRLAERNR